MNVLGLFTEMGIFSKYPETQRKNFQNYWSTLVLMVRKRKNFQNYWNATQLAQFDFLAQRNFCNNYLMKVKALRNFCVQFFAKVKTQRNFCN